MKQKLSKKQSRLTQTKSYTLRKNNFITIWNGNATDISGKFLFMLSILKHGFKLKISCKHLRICDDIIYIHFQIGQTHKNLIMSYSHANYESKVD